MFFLLIKLNFTPDYQKSRTDDSPVRVGENKLVHDFLNPVELPQS